MGITGAAIASLAGYCVMFVVALYWLASKQQMDYGNGSGRGSQDIPVVRLRSLLRPASPTFRTRKSR